MDTPSQVRISRGRRPPWRRLDSPQARYRVDLASRTVAAVVGGYILSAAATGVLGLILPLPRAEAVLMATMSSFTIYTLLVMWAFYEARPQRVWGGVLGGSTALILLLRILQPGGSA